MAERRWEVELLLVAWSDLDRALTGVSDTDAVHQIDGGSSFAWTLAHVTNGVDSWINVRFLGMPPHPLISHPRFRMGGDGSADNWQVIREAVNEVRAPARAFLLRCTAIDLDRTIPYDGSYPLFREYGLNLRLAILQNAMHHTFHLGEIAAKRQLLGYEPGYFPGSVIQAR
jgi:hypothetical protein